MKKILFILIIPFLLFATACSKKVIPQNTVVVTKDTAFSFVTPSDVKFWKNHKGERTVQMFISLEVTVTREDAKEDSMATSGITTYYLYSTPLVKYFRYHCPVTYVSDSDDFKKVFVKGGDSVLFTLPFELTSDGNKYKLPYRFDFRSFTYLGSIDSFGVPIEVYLIFVPETRGGDTLIAPGSIARESSKPSELSSGKDNSKIRNLDLSTPKTNSATGPKTDKKQTAPAQKEQAPVKEQPPKPVDSRMPK